MAGGRGTRFWPLSTSVKPKQFLALTSEQTMIQEAYRRFREWLPADRVHVVTAAEYVPLIRSQLTELAAEQLIVEPERRDTGPCMALTALHFLRRGDDEVLVTAPSDHYVSDPAELRRALELAEQTARQDRNIVTLGIVPTRPETGYGYIDAGAAQEPGEVLPVRRFMEKPSLDDAERLYRTERVYWNSGVFVWKPSTIAYYMKRLQPELWSRLSGAGDEELKDVYPHLPKISVDYAVLEKAESIYTVPVRFQWDDVGAWTALERLHPMDEHGNVISGDVLTLDAERNIIRADGAKAAVIGVSDLIIVSTAGGLLVCHKDHEQSIKKLADRLDRPKEDPAS
jgi:mannose-1-phosphate guanylyltransferase